MDIKQYDIVKYRGENCRVMYIDYDDDEVKISPHGWVDILDVELVESVTVPVFEPGDTVLIHPIDDGDYEYYSTTWMYQMDRHIGKTATVLEVDKFEGSYKLSNTFLFAPYHLEKISDYDMI